LIPPADVIIRRARREDAAAVAELAAATFDETFGHLYARRDLEAFLEQARSEPVYAGLIADGGAHVALTTVAGEPVGYSVAGGCKLPVPDLEPRAGEVRELYLLSSHQGRGLGSRMLEEALGWLEDEGYDPLYVGVWSDNQGAQRLYGRYGFEKIGEYNFPVGEHVDREYILKRYA
jgi:ribosomal protein S18 acetylase RimI-like enzyme